MKLPTFIQFNGIVIIVNTLLPVFLALSLIWMYAFHFKPLIEEFQGPFFDDLKSLETVLERYRSAEKVASEAYEPIADLSRQVASLSISVCGSSQVEKILLFRDETLAKLEVRNSDFHHHFVKVRVERPGDHIPLGQKGEFIKPVVRDRFSEYTTTADLKGWLKDQLQERIERPDPSPPRDPSDPIVSPTAPKLDPSATVGDLASTVRDHAEQISSLAEKLQGMPAETCERLESHFQAVFFVFSSVFALFDEIKTGFSDFKNYLDVDLEAVWLKASSLYQVVKYLGIAILFWLIVSYATWIFERLERGWTMIAGQGVKN